MKIVRTTVSHNSVQTKGNKMLGIKDDNVLELKGNELTIFAIIYSFSQDGESEFKGSISYLQKFANIESKQTVYTMLDRLKTKHYIKKRGFKEGNIQRYAYSADLESIELMKKGLSELQPDNSE